MTPEQQKVLALARARRKRAESELGSTPPPPQYAPGEAASAAFDELDRQKREESSKIDPAKRAQQAFTGANPFASQYGNPENIPQGVKEFTGDMARQAGLTGRAIVEGVAEVPAIAANAVAGAANIGMDVIDRIRGRDLSDLITGEGEKFRFKDQRALLSGLLTQMGIPEAENEAERLTQQASRGLVNVATGVGAGQLMAKSAAPVVAGVGETLSTQPIAQAVGSATGPATGEAARAVTEYAGGGETAQNIAEFTGNLVGGVAPSFRQGATGKRLDMQKTQSERVNRNLEIAADTTEKTGIGFGKGQATQSPADEINILLARKSQGGSETVKALDLKQNNQIRDYEGRVLEGISDSGAMARAGLKVRDAANRRISEQHTQPAVKKLDAVLSKIAPDEAANDAGAIAKKAAEEFKKSAIERRKAATDPFYGEAKKVNPKIDISKIEEKGASIIEELGPKSGDSMHIKHVIDNLRLGLPEGDLKPNLKRAHATRGIIDDLLYEGKPKLGSRGVEELGKIRILLNDEIQKVSPQFRSGDELFEAMTKAEIDSIDNGALGVFLRKADVNADTIIDDIMSPNRYTPKQRAEVFQALDQAKAGTSAAVYKSWINKKLGKLSDENAQPSEYLKQLFPNAKQTQILLDSAPTAEIRRELAGVKARMELADKAIKGSFLGKIAGKSDADVYTEVSTLFNPKNTNISQFLDAKKEIEAIDPSAWRDIFRQKIEGSLGEATSLDAEDATNLAKTNWGKLFSTDAQTKMLIEGAPDAATAENVKYLKRAYELAQIGRRGTSDTKALQDADKKLRNSGIWGAMKRVLSPKGSADELLGDLDYNQKTAVLAEAVTSTKWASKMAEIKKLPPESPRAAMLFQNLIQAIANSGSETPKPEPKKINPYSLNIK